MTSDTENLGGAQGLVGADSIIPPSKQGLIEGYYYAYVAIAVIVGIALLVYWWVSSGRLGLRLRTARESEPVAQAFGIDIPRARLAVFVITAGVLGLVGAFRAGYDAGANKSVFSFSHAAAAVRDDRRRRHQLAQGHPARDGAAAVDRAALRQLGRPAADPARRDHAR